MKTYLDKLMENKEFKEKFKKEEKQLMENEKQLTQENLLKEIILKKDIVIPKGTVFDNCDNTSTKFIYDNFEAFISLDKDTDVRIIASSENKKYFK